MKTGTSLFSMLMLLASNVSAETLTVTTTEMDAATEGSLLYVMANLPETEAVIEFDFDGETLAYNTAACTGFNISNKTIRIDGINKRNNMPVAISGVSSFLNLSNSANVTIENLTLSGF